ncbi:probable inorganic phosphate transporter 1-9 [Oryza glaberrima]|uniref:probable inorganic phosphate transporter 1-9 n=1 Tax=Oryza glaberrima TaxID=4538 RepID=UPI00224BED49|nr:probable inorganic phosphate transporter 1-9 [Oryza glaberrima]
MSEYANKRTRGAFIAAVFAMQGSGILFGAIVALAVSAGFPHAYPVSSYSDNHAASLIPQADYVWRIIVMFGTVPAALTYYWRMKMPETAWHTALIARNTKQAAADMSKVLHTQIEESVGHAETVRRWSSAARPGASSRASSCAATASTSSPPPARDSSSTSPPRHAAAAAGDAAAAAGDTRGSSEDMRDDCGDTRGGSGDTRDGSEEPRWRVRSAREGSGGPPLPPPPVAPPAQATSLSPPAPTCSRLPVTTPTLPPASSAASTYPSTSTASSPASPRTPAPTLGPSSRFHLELMEDAAALL